MKLFGHKLNSGGFSHYLIPLVVVVVVGGIGSYLLVNSHAQTASCRHQTFGQGSGGQCVMDIQKVVRDFGTHETYSSYFKYGSRSVIQPQSFLDGDYGPNTAAQVKNFQAWFPNSGGADGVVGPKTWGPLCSSASAYLSKATYNQLCG